MEELPYDSDKNIKYSDLRKYDKKKKEVSLKQDIEFIDLFEVMKYKENIDYLQEGLHPNNKGHKLVYQVVKNRLKQLDYI